MGWRDRRPEPRDTNAVLLKQIEQLSARVRKLEQSGPTTLQLIDMEDYDDAENVDIGELHVNWPGVHREARRYDPAVYFHNDKWRALGSNAAVYEIKVFEDDEDNVVEDRAFVWEIPEDLDGCEVLKAGAFITTVGGSSVSLNITDDIAGGAVLESNIEIPAGIRSSRFGTTPQAVNGAYPVEWGDQLAINTLSISGRGLGVWVLVAGAGVGGVLLQGLQGPPGGITNWKGQYGGVGATYLTGEVVNNGGVTYVAIVDHTSTVASEPGVGADWEDFWMVLVQGHKYTTLSYVIDGQGKVLDTGIKGAGLPIDFACIIRQVTLVADASGNIVIDIWKDTYGNHPPTNADSITGSSPPTLSGAIKTKDSVLSGWTTSISDGDILRFNIDSVSNIRSATVSFKLERV